MHRNHCPSAPADGPSCTCPPDVQCPALYVDEDGDTHRCTHTPGHGPGHASWGAIWTDNTCGVTYESTLLGPDGDPCAFCEIIAGRAPATIVREWPDVLAFFPLDPVVEGHTLVVPKRHSRDFAADPEGSAAAMLRAAELMRWTPKAMNVITSRGEAATQSVFHTHLHLVPRAEDDGLALPWYSGKRRRARAEGDAR